MDKKLGVIVPYRNREEQLPIFVDAITTHLNQSNIPFELIIVEQDDEKQFNRGKLLNVGYTFAKKLNCDYLCFHDVDMVPVDVDYSYSPHPLHLATDFILEDGEKEREIFEEYFGGVTLFPIEDFEKINGYSNKYWGWGYEDTDLLHRCRISRIDLRTLEVENVGKHGKVVVFNGVNSYVEGDNIFNLNQDCTFFMSFNPSHFVFDYTKETDEYSVFSVPGWDFTVFCNSFFRYSFSGFDNKLNPLYVNTNIKPNYKTNITLTVNNNEKRISLYQDGVLIGKTEQYKKLYFYRKEPKFYLGVGNPKREDNPNYYKGSIDTFAYYDEVLSDEVIKDISKNKTHRLNEEFDTYKPQDYLKLYYDAEFIEENKMIDLSGNGHHGSIVNCGLSLQKFPEYKIILTPHRRSSLFKSLKHDENGFHNNKWKNQATRWNQLRYHNEVVLNRNLMKDDGLVDLEFTTHDIVVNNNVTMITVGL